MLIRPNDGYEPEFCEHPENRVEWRRDEPAYRWVGFCRKCGTGPTLHRGQEPIVRTDEQIARGEVPPVPAVDQFLRQEYLLLAGV